MSGLIRKLLQDRRGNVLAIACACMPLVVGAAGLATDTIEWTLWKRQLQRAADSAALAGVYDRVQATNGATTNTPTAVCNDLAVNLQTWMSLKATSPCTGTKGSYTTLTYPADTTYVTKQVQVTLQVQQALPFSSLFMSAAPTIQASATAGTVSYGGAPCMLALNTTGTAINNSGNTTVSAPTCILYSDSAASNSAAAGGSSAITAKAVAGVGGIQSSNNWNVQSYLPYSPSLPDPFGPSGSNPITPDPNDMHCTNAAADKNTDWAAMKAAGINCFSSMSTNPHDVINVPSNWNGPIYINGGSVDFKGDFTCTSCTIVLTNKSTASNATIGTFSSNSQATNNITAPTSGTYKGIAVYQDRRATGNVDKINGGANNIVSGVVYFPNDTLWLNGTGNTVSLCAMWIAKNLVFNGNSSIGISSASDTACSGQLPSNLATTTIVRLIS
jgi:Putative Flp pilus-assembly TadE/G-like